MCATFSVHLDAERAQVVGDELRGAHLAVAELGMLWMSRRDAMTDGSTRAAALIDLLLQGGGDDKGKHCEEYKIVDTRQGDRVHVPVRRLTLAVALLLTLTGATPKRPQIPSLGETIEVNIVNVDVVVTDKDGNRVRGLTKSDFTILEDGKPREISNFAEFASPLPDDEIADRPTVDSPPAQPRTVLLFIERDTKLPPFDAERFIDSLRDTVRNTIRRGDAAGVVIWADTGQVRVDFTDDVEKIDLVLEHAPRASSRARSARRRSSSSPTSTTS